MTDEARGGETTKLRPLESWWAPVLRLLRWLLGAASLVAGLTWILLNLSGPSAVLDTAVGCVLAAGGLVLLMPHRIRLPRLATAAAMTVTALGGSAAGVFAQRAEACCSYAYIVDRGWPFHWVQRAAIADDPDTAQRLAQGANWHVDLVSLAGNLLVFAYAGLIVVVIAVLIRRRRS